MNTTRALAVMVIASALLLAGGCATKVTKIGNTYPATNPKDVQVFATEKPKCELEELGLIRTPLKSNQDEAVESAKEKAAEIGAQYMQITDVKRNLFNDAAVNAVAYRCKQ